MFTKTTFAKFALVPLAAANVLSNVASASPAPALQVRGDYTPSPTSSDYWPKKTDCDCDWSWDKDHGPKITQPNKDTVWHVGDHQKVTWEVKWDDKKDGGYDDKKDDGYDDKKDGGYDDKKDGDYDDKDWKDGKDGEDWKDGKDGKDWDDKKCQWDNDKDGKQQSCKTRLFLRKGDDLPFLILAEGFDIKAGSVDVTVPNVFFGSDYRVTLSVRDDKPGLMINSDKFKITKDDKDHDNCKDWDGKECKDWKDGKDGKNDGY